MPKPKKPTIDPEQRIAELERELELKDERVRELKSEADEDREQIRRMREFIDGVEEHLQERDEYLERFITTFGLTLNDEGCWENGEAINQQRAQLDEHEALRLKYNKLVNAFNRYIAVVNPVGRPIAASEAQQAQIIRHHKAGKSSRWIAEEMTLSRRTVTTVIGKLDGSDRATNQHRRRLGLEPKKKD